ncbi:MAG: tryptophan synthase subunit alpha [Chitinophagaceae bacterium]|nr:MAG: tryptophan synthase subunit alpha [Chitinophagaceae bacterium]
MTRLSELFQRKKERVLNVYCTAGYPELESTLPVMHALAAGGADIIELGMPYSDPLADGPVIQASGARALRNGMSIGKLFEQLASLRPALDVPVVLMGYLNPLLQYGFEAFCAKARACGVDGLIIPDIPLHAYEREYKAIVERHGLDFIFLVTPETSEARVRDLDAASSGFLYAVSSSSVTGSAKDFSPVEEYLARLEELRLRNPVLVGFGIHDKATFDAACRHARGAIIGSAYIRALYEPELIQEATATFLAGILREEKR